MSRIETIADIRARHPRLREAVVADARMTAAYRFERSEFRSRADALVQVLRLMLVSDAFLGHVLYRLKARLQALGVPFLPHVAHRLAMMTAGIAIGDPVVMAPGVYIAHGQVVIDGIVEIGAGAVIAPFVSIGLRSGSLHGPKVEPNVSFGTGSRSLGPFHIGTGAQIGANAVVLDDVPAGAIVVGMPARPIGS